MSNPSATRLLAAAGFFLPLLAGTAFAQTASPPAQPAAQQSRMADCNADAKTQALTGDARKTFMAECLSNKVAAAPAVTPAVAKPASQAVPTAAVPAPKQNAVAPTSAPSKQVASNPPPAQAAGAPVNLNTATSEQLDGLWGIGKARAATIIANRPFKSVEDLHARKLIPENVFSRIKDQLVVR